MKEGGLIWNWKGSGIVAPFDGETKTGIASNVMGLTIGCCIFLLVPCSSGSVGIFVIHHCLNQCSFVE